MGLEHAQPLRGGERMSDPVIITVVICLTLLAMTVLSYWQKK